MLLHCDSFQTASTGDMHKWDYSTGSFAPTVGTTIGRDGGRCIENDTGGRGYYSCVAKTLPETQGLGGKALFAALSAFFPTNNVSTSFFPIISMVNQPWTAPSVSFTGKTGLVLLYQPSTGYLRLSRYSNGTGTVLVTMATSIPINQWTRIEMKLDIDGDSAIVHVDGVEVLNSATDLATLSSGINQVAFGNQYTRVDDTLIWNSDAGDGFTTWMGDLIIECLLPNAVGNYSQFSRSTGTINYTLVDEQGLTTTDYVYATAPDTKDSYGYSDLSVTPTTVHAVVVNNIMRPFGGTSRPFVGGLARVGGTDLIETGVKIPNVADQHLRQTVFATKPGGGAWAAADVNGAEFGLVLTANG